MVQLTNSTPVTLAPGQTMTFDKVDLDTGNCTCYRSLGGSVKMNSRGIYEIIFSGNISGATAGTPIQLSIALSGIAIPEGLMISTPSAADALNNVSRTVLVRNGCGDFDRVSVVNNGTDPVTVGVGATLQVLKVR